MLEIDGRRPRDVLDVMVWGDGPLVRLRLRRGDREIRVKVAKEEGRPLGLVFETPVFDGVITCRNRCRFCFVDQMPAGLRSSLYLKDDDYRLSFWCGNFITLNNLTASEVRRILSLRLSPLYVSLHTTDPSLRSILMGRGAERGLQILRLFLRKGLDIHLQVVCCPGINDGSALRRTFEEVLGVYRAASLGVVPVGLTHQARERAPRIRPHDSETASRVLELVEEFQEQALEIMGKRLFFASDEFYLLAGREFPSREEYEDFPQLENGIGMARKFMDEIYQCQSQLAANQGAGRDQPSLRSDEEIPGMMPGVLTGMAGEPVLRQALGQAGMEGVEVVTVENSLFGGTVTVTSLLGGGDLIRALREEAPSSRDLLIPETLLREGRFLDDLTLEDVVRQTGYQLRPVRVEGSAIMAALLGGLAEKA
ncbi:MAG: DUF512 domain-containing protein [Actinomycetota bacterium]